VGLTLKLVSYDLHDLYLRASPSIRRLMNQAIFETIGIEADEDQRVYLRSKLASPFADMQSLRAELARVGADKNDKAPDPWAGAEALVVGSITDQMVGAPGFEPGTSPTRIGLSIIGIL
jgi:hypothetical protein